MPYMKNTSYRDIIFSLETPKTKSEFYIFSTVPELAAKSEMSKDDLVLCRTVGILHSTEGRFYMTDVDTPTLSEDEPKIRVTMIYLKSPPPSLVIPYPVQLFGSLQWKNRPVIFAKLVEVITNSLAIQVRATLTAVTSSHLATGNTSVEETDVEVSYSELDDKFNDTFVLDSTPCNEEDKPS